jgi:tetratricopeptide (TPR) repeat protein
VDRTRALRLASLLIALVAFAACAAPVTERAQSLVRQHREDDAIKVLRQRLTEHPEDVPARKLLVRVLGLVGDLPAAHAEVAELARRLPPNDPSPPIELGHALELSHRYDEALAAYDEAAAVAPHSPAGPLEGGLRCARWGEARDALPRLEEAVRRGARDASTWHALGLVRVHLGDLDEAEEAYRAGAAADPAQLDNWLGLATVAVVRGSGEAALTAYDAILARNPHFAPAVLGRAWALARLGRTAEARDALDLAEKLGAPHDNVQRQRAVLGASATGSSGTR